MTEAAPVRTINLHHLAGEAVTGAIGRGLTVATAESLTAGMVAAVLADTPGASGMLQGGVVSYQNSVKADVLGVPPGTAGQPSAPSTGRSPRPWPTGARSICGADIGVSTTGVAGPEPHDGKAVGTVFIGIATAEGSTSFAYTASRATGRKSAARPALRPWNACWKLYLPKATGRKVAGNKSRFRIVVTLCRFRIREAPRMKASAVSALTGGLDIIEGARRYRW